MVMGGIEAVEKRHPEFLYGLENGRRKSKGAKVCYLEGTDGIKVVKQLNIGAKQAKFIGELLTYLNGSGLTPELLRPESGAAYFWFKGGRYFVTRYLPGRPAEYYQLQDLQAAIRSMARLHRLSEDFLAAYPRWRLSLKFEPVQVWQSRLRELEICRERAIRFRQNSWCRQYLRFWYFFWLQALKAVEELRSLPARRPAVICYHDWAFHNLIINNGDAALIDFDYALVDDAVHDRANLIGRYLRLHQWSNEALLKALWNFDRIYPWRAGDLRRLRIYLTFPYEYWILGRQFFLERQPWSEKYFQDQWKRKIADIEGRNQTLELIESLE